MTAPFPLMNTFIFRPGATSGTRFDAGVPVYTDWDELYAELSAVNATEACEILFDGAANAGICIIPTGGGPYNMQNTRWVGAGGWGPNDLDARVLVQFAGLVAITDLYWIEHLNINNNASATPPITIGSSIFLRNSSFSRTGIQGPIFKTAVSGNCNIWVSKSTFGLVSRPVLQVLSTGTTRIHLRDQGASADTDFATGSVGSLEFHYTPSSSQNLPSFASYSGITAITLDGHNPRLSHQNEIEVVPANTVNNYFFVPGNITIVAVKAYVETVPVTAGVYTVAIEDVDLANNLLTAATENLKGLTLATLTSFTLTATPADLDLVEGTKVRIQVVSDNADLVATGVYVQILYRSR